MMSPDQIEAVRRLYDALSDIIEEPSNKITSEHRAEAIESMRDALYALPELDDDHDLPSGQVRLSVMDAISRAVRQTMPSLEIPR